MKSLLQNNRQKEYGGAMIMAWLAILMFLFMSILMLDVPYIERVGRATQRAVDAAALAGAVQLQRSTVNADTVANTLAFHQLGWRNSKRAAFLMLGNTINTINGAANLFFASPIRAPLQFGDPLDLGDIFDVPIYNVASSSGGGPVTANLQIYRGYYSRANAGTANAFTSLEVSNVNVRSMSSTAPVNQTNVCRRRNGAPEPAICPVFPAPGIPAVSVANAMNITLTINNVPTLFAKILGFNSFTSITRSATAVPQ